MKVDDSRVIGGKLYEVHPVRDPFLRKQRFKWAGYCGLDRIGFYTNKGDFWRAVEWLAMRAEDEQCKLSAEVEKTAGLEGARILDALHLWNGKRK